MFDGGTSDGSGDTEAPAVQVMIGAASATEALAADSATKPAAHKRSFLTFMAQLPLKRSQSARYHQLMHMPCHTKPTRNSAEFLGKGASARLLSSPNM
jgi:hypothetical protein